MRGETWWQWDIWACQSADIGCDLTAGVIGAFRYGVAMETEKHAIHRPSGKGTSLQRLQKFLHQLLLHRSDAGALYPGPNTGSML